VPQAQTTAHHHHHQEATATAASANPAVGTRINTVA
jgi:hypothetical protein